MQKNTITRKNITSIRLYCLPEEKQKIEAKAKEAGLTVSAFLLATGQGKKLRSVLDHQGIQELAKITADLGRLGGILKLWLTDDERVRHFRRETIQKVLNRINGNQDKVAEVMKSIVRNSLK